MNNEKNYSIIIPHKNIPKLLQRCLDSIPRRKDVQIIVVDDASDPEIVNFEQFPGLNDPFVEVIFAKEGKSAGYARNIGLKRAVGKWLLFSDADDFFNYCINDVLDEYANSDSDIVYFRHSCIDSDTYMTTPRAEAHNNRIRAWLHSSRKDDYPLRFINSSVWSKLFKTELIKKNNIAFDEISIAADITFSYLSGFYAASISADLRALYCTTIRKGSIRHSKRSIEKILDIIFVESKRYRFFKDHNISVYKNIPLLKLLLKIYIKNKPHFNNAKKIISDFNISYFDVIKIFIYDAILLAPKRMLGKFFLSKTNGKNKT